VLLAPTQKNEHVIFQLIKRDDGIYLFRNTLFKKKDLDELKEAVEMIEDKMYPYRHLEPRG